MNLIKFGSFVISEITEIAGQKFSAKNLMFYVFHATIKYKMNELSTWVEQTSTKALVLFCNGKAIMPRCGYKTAI